MSQQVGSLDDDVTGTANIIRIVTGPANQEIVIRRASSQAVVTAAAL
jgi:hypothetical protein